MSPLLRKDHDPEVARLRWLLGVLVVLLVSGFFAWDEGRYLIWGKAAEARVRETHAATEVSTRGRSVPATAVEYAFRHESTGEMRAESDMVTRLGRPDRVGRPGGIHPGRGPLVAPGRQLEPCGAGLLLRLAGRRRGLRLSPGPRGPRAGARASARWHPLAMNPPIERYGPR